MKVVVRDKSIFRVAETQHCFDSISLHPVLHQTEGEVYFGESGCREGQEGFVLPHHLKERYSVIYGELVCHLNIVR